MENIKLTQVLRTFTKNEWREFSKFADSPYFNKGRNYRPLLKELKRYYPQFSSRSFSKQNIYKKLFPGKVYKETVLKTMISGLHRLAIKFLIQKNVESNDNVIQPRLLNELRLRKLNSHAEKLIREKKQLYKNKKIDLRDFFNKMILQEEIHDFYHATDQRKKIASERIKFAEYILYYFTLEMLVTEKEMILEKNFLKSSFKSTSLGRAMVYINIQKIIGLIEKNDPANYPLLSIYYNILMSYKYLDDDTYYFKLKSLTEEFADNMGLDLKARIYLNLESICSQKTLTGRVVFYDEHFEILEKIISENIYAFFGLGNFISNRLFRSIVSTSLYLKKYQWLNEFIAKYIHKTDPEFTEHLFHYSHAHLCFAEGKLDESLYHATKIEQKQFIYKIDIKNLISRIYYDTGSIEELYSMFDSYSHLLKNTTSQNKEMISRNVNFIAFLKRIVKIKISGSDKFGLKKLETKLGETKYISSKRWLLEKITELENKKSGV